MGNLNAEHALVSVHTDDYSHTLASCFQRILETYLACIFNKHGPIDVAKDWIALTENEIWVCMHVYDLKTYQHFPPAFLRGCVMTEHQGYLRKLHFQTGLLQHVVSVSQQVGGYCLLCAVPSLNMWYNDHHQFQ